MTEVSKEDIRLFLYNCAVVHSEMKPRKDSLAQSAVLMSAIDPDDELKPYLFQFDNSARERAQEMSVWYMLFYMLENDIRTFIREALQEKDPSNWWETCVPEPVRREVATNRTREQDFGSSPRSDELLDYTTFGQLGDIIRENWDVFGGLLSSQKAMGRVMATLNALRGPIAHCGVLAPDETDRLKLSVKDWFRLVAGPSE